MLCKSWGSITTSGLNRDVIKKCLQLYFPYFGVKHLIHNYSISQSRDIPTISVSNYCFRFARVGRMNEGCLIAYPKSYQLISLQCRQPNVLDWVKVSPTKTTDNGNTITIECHQLPVGHSFEFRGLFKRDNDDIAELKSDKIIKIIGKNIDKLFFPICF